MNSKIKSRRPLTEVQMTGSAKENEMVGKKQLTGKKLHDAKTKPVETGSEPPPSSTDTTTKAAEVQKNALAKVKSGLVSKKKKVGKVFISKEVQTENGDIALVTGEEAPLEYWKELAETRRKALEEALDENYTLHQRVEELEKEKAVLEEMVEHAKSLATMLEDLSDEDPDESGIGFGNRKDIDDSILEKDAGEEDA